ncbi:hypothetical protein UT300012_39160 [Paraclostridium bifermentans]
MEQLELAYDHYKDSFTLIREAEKERNKLFILVVLLVTALYLFAIEPNSLYQILKDLIKEHSKVSMNFGFTTIQSLLWIILLFYTIRYFQINSYINRQYDYLHRLENSIDDKVDITFNREGRGYLDNYPKFLDLVYYIYTWIFPLIYICIVSYKIIGEWINSKFSLHILFNSSIAGTIVIATILYLRLIHTSKSSDNSCEDESLEVDN